MNKLNWDAWLYGLISALLVFVLTYLTAWATMPDNVTTKQLIAVCVIPGLGTFIAWLKQTPPPVGK